MLHDCGRIKDKPNEKVFHGLVGYDYMMLQNQPEIARISLTHCFYEKDFNLDTYPQKREDLLRSKQIIMAYDYNDYDLLLQLADMINDMGQSCTLEHHCHSIVRRYGIPFQKLAHSLEILSNIKHSFDIKCGCNVYELIGINN